MSSPDYPFNRELTGFWANDLATAPAGSCLRVLAERRTANLEKWANEYDSKHPEGKPVPPKNVTRLDGKPLTWEDYIQGDNNEALWTRGDYHLVNSKGQAVDENAKLLDAPAPVASSAAPQAATTKEQALSGILKGLDGLSSEDKRDVLVALIAALGNSQTQNIALEPSSTGIPRSKGQVNTLT